MAAPQLCSSVNEPRDTLSESLTETRITKANNKAAPTGSRRTHYPIRKDVTYPINQRKTPYQTHKNHTIMHKIHNVHRKIKGKKTKTCITSPNP